MKLNESIKEEIEAAVKLAEEQTSVEFVPVWKKQSSHYTKERLLVSLSAGVLILLIELFYAFKWSWEGTSLSHFGASLCGALLVGGLLFFVSSTRFGLRTFIPSKIREAVIEKKARDAFLDYEIFATKERTGVLIYISEFERAIFILADKGISKVIEPEEWATLAQHLAKDFACGGESFLNAIKQVLDKVKTQFPKSDQNPNEIPDHVRE